MERTIKKEKKDIRTIWKHRINLRKKERKKEA